MSPWTISRSSPKRSTTSSRPASHNAMETIAQIVTCQKVAKRKWAWRRSLWDSSELRTKQCADQSEHWHRLLDSFFSFLTQKLEKFRFVPPSSGQLLYYYLCTVCSTSYSPLHMLPLVASLQAATDFKVHKILFTGEGPRYVSACAGVFRRSRRATRVRHRTSAGHENHLHTQVRPRRWRVTLSLFTEE